VVLFFYPKDDTPGCTKEANAFNAALADFKKKNAEVIGISKVRTRTISFLQTDFDAS
jgi:peroxiredoxin Q/BCP